MSRQFQRTNDHRLIGHIAKHFKLDPDCSIQDLMASVDASVPNAPLSFRDLLIVYETFPVYGDFMFSKGKSYIWKLIESTDSPMLLTDSLISGKEGLFICQPVTTGDYVDACACAVLKSQKSASLSINRRGTSTALLYPLASL